MKKVLLIVIDALSSRVVQPAIDENRLPNLRLLRQASNLQRDSVSVFPSITPAATSSLITGTYPRRHGISGAYWYQPHDKTVVYFGYDFWAMLNEGLDKFVNDFLVRLNAEHLQADTLFQIAERSGLTSASLNYLIYHGDVPHEIKMPFFVELLSGAPEQAEIGGPSILQFGDVIQSPLPTGKAPSAPGGMFNRFGFSDDTTGELLLEMVQEDALPDFTLAYFPENDAESHQNGPEVALAQMQILDEKLGRIFAARGGLSQLLSEVCVVLTGDHSQSDVVDEPQMAGIRLDQLLESFSVADAGTPMTEENDLVICPNLRTAQFYFHSPTQERIDRVVELLLADPRVDQVIWNSELLDSESRDIHVVTQDRGHLHFWTGSDGTNSARDLYGNAWSWKGDLRTVDGYVVENTLSFGDYPNAFERIEGILSLETSGHLWVTSRPGYEFCLAHTQIHTGGGSHGSLHVLDSVSPLWVAGAPDKVALPLQPRGVDVVPLCLAILGIEQEESAGVERIARQVL